MRLRSFLKTKMWRRLCAASFGTSFMSSQPLRGLEYRTLKLGSVLHWMKCMVLKCGRYHSHWLQNSKGILQMEAWSIHVYNCSLYKCSQGRNLFIKEAHHLSKNSRKFLKLTFLVAESPRITDDSLNNTVTGKDIHCRQSFLSFRTLKMWQKLFNVYFFWTERMLKL